MNTGTLAFSSCWAPAAFMTYCSWVRFLHARAFAATFNRRGTDSQSVVLSTPHELLGDGGDHRRLFLQCLIRPGPEADWLANQIDVGIEVDLVREPIGL